MTKLNPIGSGKPDISVVDAAIVTISEKVDSVRKELDTQRSETKNIIIGVVIALVAIVATVAVEVILSNKYENNFDSRFNLTEKINNQQIQINDLQNKFDNLKIRNTYLK